MADVDIKWKHGCFYNLRREPGVVAKVEAVGRGWLKKANASLPEKTGYRMSSQQGRKKPQGRWAVRVYTASNHAKRSNARHQTLTHIVNGGA